MMLCMFLIESLHLTFLHICHQHPSHLDVYLLDEVLMFLPPRGSLRYPSCLYFPAASQAALSDLLTMMMNVWDLHKEQGDHRLHRSDEDELHLDTERVYMCCVCVCMRHICLIFLSYIDPPTNPGHLKSHIDEEELCEEGGGREEGGGAQFITAFLLSR